MVRILDNTNTPITVIGQVIDIAEHTSYLELTSRVCFYDEPNLNNDMLPTDDTTLEKALTLVNMPVQAKYRLSPSGEPTFSGHEMKKSKSTGEITFGTSSVGTHTEVYIENDNVDVNGTIKNLPCLFAKYRIWKRYKNVVAAVQRLFSLGKLYSSWEINTYQYIFDRGIRKITDYEFLANCLLGYEYAYPSYGTSANAISMAQLNDNQLMIAEALSQDLLDENNINDNDEEESLLAKKNESSPAVENIIASASPEAQNGDATNTTSTAEDKQNETPTTDSAQLTVWDLKTRVGEACRKKLGKWCWASFMFPNEKEVWCEYDGAESELDYVKFTYEVADDDTVTVSEPEYVKLTVSIAEVNTKISELEKEIQTVKAELDIKNDAIIKASETIQSLNTQISELAPYKEQVEVAERKKIEEQITAEKESLKNKLLKGNLFTEAEIAEKKIQDLIEARDVSAINSLIADKFVASFDIEHKTENAETVTVSTAETVVTATANLESEDTETDVRSFMSKILSN
ncbi:hypothetical protein AMURIS_04980 [Acetatifactor muris]|uniref:Uncharacterized protein n=1 Tax=Acetatifactor muris TaxID=879566 RepID=A0A2K4ZPB9_9FIRM|nr:hypothetical protein [Acetatifactor muris]SOY32222.1 hypothetical protein AMURIS_04980 [Acetatifactor muris]